MKKLESLISCSTCKGKKIRCGRELPICYYCQERGIVCVYSDQIKRRGTSEAGITTYLNKYKVNSKLKSDKQVSKSKNNLDIKLNRENVNKFVIFQPLPKPNSSYSDYNNSQSILTKIKTSNIHKFETNILLILSTQIIDYDINLVPQIDSFISKLELGIFGGVLKFSIHMSQDWIIEMLSADFENKCISSYFYSFHPLATYISKYKFFTNLSKLCPILKSVIILVGYSIIGKQHPELLKYLKHMAIVHLKRNMFNIRVSVCQALFIFSYYMLFQGLAKQSLVYFHQAYLMASALGIHKDVPNLNPVDTHERQIIRFTSYKQDSHLCNTLSIQVHYLFLSPTWIPLNPLYQTNPQSKDPIEFLIAECICISIKCYNIYWTSSANLMNNYSQLTINKSEAYLLKNNFRVIKVLENLLNNSLVYSLALYLELSERYSDPNELKIVKQFAKMIVGIYHSLNIVLNSQFSLTNLGKTELDTSTIKLVKSAISLYQLTLDVVPLCLPMFYHYLCQISLLYIKLILNYSNLPPIKNEFLEKLKEVYDLFKSYQIKYNLPYDLIDVVDTMKDYFKIKF